MNDFSTVNAIIEDSVKSSSYTTVIISSLVFIIYTIIIKVIDVIKAKNKNKPIIEMANAIKEVTSNVIKLNTVLDKALNETKLKEETKTKAAIELAFNSYCSDVTREVITIIINNHIEANRQLIIENIIRLVNTEYYKIYATLSNYEFNGISVSSRLEKIWIDDTIKSITSIVFDTQSEVVRIQQLNNRIKMLVDSFSTHLHNKIFSNHG